MKIDEALKAVVTLYVDTAPVIYFIEANPQYDSLVREIFQRLADGKLQGITSTVRRKNRCKSG